MDPESTISEAASTIDIDPEIRINPPINPESSTDAASDLISSENFKICIHNIPRYVGAKEMKKFMVRLNFEIRKAYVVGDHAFVCFADEESVLRSLSILQNYKWKNCNLRAKRAAANVDPVLAAKKAKKSEPEENPDSDTGQPEKRLLDAVTPLHSLPYADQLLSKNKESLELLKEISRQIRSISDTDQFPACGYFGELKSILPSPAIDGYRNKCEFSIGYDGDQRPVVGFRLTRYKAGSVEIVSPDPCPHVPEMTKRIANVLGDFIRDSDLPPYDVTTRRGFWTMLTVRQFSMDVSVIVTAYQQREQERVSAAKRDLIKLFSKIDDGFRVTSLYFQLLERPSDKAAYEHLLGTPYVYENLLGLRFRISAGAFFQVNTPACELLYKSIVDICRVDDKTLVFDLCCGTGTIGIVLAAKAGKVIGIESSPEAIEDAKINAQNNERTNCEFICNKVENVIDEMRRRIGGPLAHFERVIGVLDPPRGGLPGKVLSNIRLFPGLQTVVYVSCDPKAASKNFLDLTRRTSNRYPGEAFRLKTVQPVDMFPHTKHCEWILVFER